MYSKNNCAFHPTSCFSFLISYALTCSQYTLGKRLVVLPLSTPWKTLMIGKALTSRPFFNMEVLCPAHYFSLILLYPTHWQSQMFVYHDIKNINRHTYMICFSLDSTYAAQRTVILGIYYERHLLVRIGALKKNVHVYCKIFVHGKQGVL